MSLKKAECLNTLKRRHSSDIAKLRNLVKNDVGTKLSQSEDDLYYLRYILSHPKELELASKNAGNSIVWRKDFSCSPKTREEFQKNLRFEIVGTLDNGFLLVLVKPAIAVIRASDPKLLLEYLLGEREKIYQELSRLSRKTRTLVKCVMVYDASGLSSSDLNVLRKMQKKHRSVFKEKFPQTTSTSVIINAKKVSGVAKTTLNAFKGKTRFLSLKSFYEDFEVCRQLQLKMVELGNSGFRPAASGCGNAEAVTLSDDSDSEPELESAPDSESKTFSDNGFLEEEEKEKDSSEVSKISIDPIAINTAHLSNPDSKTVFRENRVGMSKTRATSQETATENDQHCRSSETTLSDSKVKEVQNCETDEGTFKKGLVSECVNAIEESIKSNTSVDNSVESKSKVQKPRRKKRNSKKTSGSKKLNVEKSILKNVNGTKITKTKTVEIIQGDDCKKPSPVRKKRDSRKSKYEFELSDDEDEVEIVQHQDGVKPAAVYIVSSSSDEESADEEEVVVVFNNTVTTKSNRKRVVRFKDDGNEVFHVDSRKDMLYAWNSESKQKVSVKHMADNDEKESFALSDESEDDEEVVVVFNNSVQSPNEERKRVVKFKDLEAANDLKEKKGKSSLLKRVFRRKMKNSTAS